MRKMNLQKNKPAMRKKGSGVISGHAKKHNTSSNKSKQCDLIDDVDLRVPMSNAVAEKHSDIELGEPTVFVNHSIQIDHNDSRNKESTELCPSELHVDIKAFQTNTKNEKTLRDNHEVKTTPLNKTPEFDADSENGVRLLYQIYRISARGMDLEKFIRQTCAILSSELHIETLLAYLHDDIGGKIRRYHCTGMQITRSDDAKAFPEILVERLMRNRRNSDLSDKSTQNFIELEKEKISEVFGYLEEAKCFASCLIFPIFFDESLLGCLIVFLKEGEQFSKQTNSILTAVCAQLSALIQNIRLFHTLSGELEEHKVIEAQLKKVNEELANSAYTDQLTGLWNRRGLIKHVYEQIELMRVQKNKLSFLLLDIDHFKRVNDKYGHQVGDMVLIDFANLLRANSRTTDSITRWGGEEFLILTTTNLGNTAYTYAERLRKLVSLHEFPVIGEMTVSIGVAELLEGEDFDSWIKRVDDALYAAKDRNRNNVVMSSDCENE